MNKKQPTLAFCILMDVIGAAFTFIPFLGPVWAVISAIIFYRTFGGWKGAFGGIFNFVEELFPAIDFIPTFTIVWLWKRYTSREVSSSVQKPVSSPNQKHGLRSFLPMFR